MSKSIPVLSASVFALFFSACALNQFAVKTPIAPGSSLGIVAYEIIKNSDGPSERRDISMDVTRNFLSAGYAVKALNVIPFYKSYPFLEKMFVDSTSKFKVNVDDILSKTREVHTSYANDVNIKKELETVKSDMGLDYLLVVYRIQMRGQVKYFLTGIDVGNFEIVYTQSYVPSNGFALAKWVVPFYEERRFDQAIQKFISTIGQAGSGSFYGNAK